MTCVGLIPARAGSKRIPDKNTKILNGHPLLAYTIAAALESNVFTDIVVSTEGDATGAVAVQYGARWLKRPAEFATDTSPDIEWVRHALENCALTDCFSILRPTSPFRLASTIQRAWEHFRGGQVHSLRAVEPVSQHPCKMWTRATSSGAPYEIMLPFLKGQGNHHSFPMGLLEPVLVQNASLEIALSRIVENGTIAGTHVMPFFTEGREGFDINTPDDWIIAEHLATTGTPMPTVRYNRETT